MLIASHFEGRARIRDEKLTSGSLISEVREKLLEMPGVSGVEANSRTGSLLVLYSAAKTGFDSIIELISEMIGSYVEKETTEAGTTEKGYDCCGKISLTIPPGFRKAAVNIGMLASISFSLVAIIFHLKKLHVLTGIIFVALMGDHVLERRQRIFA